MRAADLRAAKQAAHQVARIHGGDKARRQRLSRFQVVPVIEMPAPGFQALQGFQGAFEPARHFLRGNHAQLFGSAAGKLLDLVYPENLYCLCCEDTMQQNRIHGICDKCAEKMEWLTHNPFKNRMDEFAFDELYSCCVYGFYARKIMHGLKLHNKTYIAKSIGLLMAEKLRTETEASQSDGEPSAEPNDTLPFAAIVPVPSSPQKLRQRGYNQAELLAQYAGKALGIPVWKDVLQKTAETASMRLASGEDRRNMLQGAFSVCENTCKKLQGKDIILLDDVVTTGSTADACAIALKDGGVRTVAVLCFASAAKAYTDKDLLS